jgi:hypothetical protein
VTDPIEGLRQTRNQAEYVGRIFDQEDVLNDLGVAERIVGLAEGILRQSG